MTEILEQRLHETRVLYYKWHFSIHIESLRHLISSVIFEYQFSNFTKFFILSLTSRLNMDIQYFVFLLKMAGHLSLWSRFTHSTTLGTITSLFRAHFFKKEAIIFPPVLVMIFVDDTQCIKSFSSLDRFQKSFVRQNWRQKLVSCSLSSFSTWHDDNESLTAFRRKPLTYAWQS